MITLFDTIIRLVLAFVFGGIIGLEREKKRGRGFGYAGLRTHILVCMGSALIMLVSLYVYESYKQEVPLDPARIAAGVVTGIGFLGAGTIIRSSERVGGLTTAASVWVSGGIGLAVGCGYISAAAVVTVLAIIALYFLKITEEKLLEK
ncbi:MAG: MgtC/SapB family protein [Candidatus Omnitrophota bacterium]|nr:MAG: MgtC/SapB family protein [Candidatus Omnitrophota bacterium]